MKNPCDTCKHTIDCENKRCEKWRQWFLKWWEDMRKNLGVE